MEPQPGTSGSVARATAPALQQRRHPPTLTMVVEALEAQPEKRGLSAVAIRRYILAKYPTVDAIRLKRLLKRALAVGLSRGLLVRPRNSTALGASGRFKLAPEKQRQGRAAGQAAPAGGTAPQPARRGVTAAPRSPGAAEDGAAAAGATAGTAAARPKARAKKAEAKKAEPRPPAPVRPRGGAVKPLGRSHQAPSEEVASSSTGTKAAPRKALAAAGKGRASGKGRAPSMATPKKRGAKAKKPTGSAQQKDGLVAADAPKTGRKAA